MLSEDVDAATFAATLDRLAGKIDALGAAIESIRPAAPRLAFRLEELAEALGVGRRVIQRERAAGRFPEPDRHLGRVPLWSVDSIRAWLARKGRA